jgi:hypothetical protein
MDYAVLKAEILIAVQKAFRDSLFELPDIIAERITSRLAEKSAPIWSAVPDSDTPPPEVPVDEPPQILAAEAQLQNLRREKDYAHEELESLRTSIAAARADAEVAEKNCACEAAKAAAELDHVAGNIAEETNRLARLKSESASLETQIAAARQLTAQAEPMRRQQEEIQTRAIALHTHRLALESQRAAIEEQRKGLENQRAEFEGHKSSSEEARCLLEQLWPAWLRSGALASWRTRLEPGIADPTAPPSFALLFAAVHTYNAALRDPDPKTLLDGLRDLGRRLYAWLRDNDCTDADAARAAEQWAGAINADCAGRSEIEVPIPGNAANNQWMIFQPRGGSSPDVVSVRSWCVRDAQQRPVHRAEVSV